jgi:DNA-binding HxlR family transcriptional regulator
LLYCQAAIYTGVVPKRYNQSCPVAKTLEVIGDRWTLLVVRDLLPGARRFQDLEEHGLIGRRFYSDHPPRAEYALTDMGRELGMIVGALAAWGGRHVYKQAKLVHADCGHPVSVGYYCQDCRKGVRGAHVTMKRGRPRSGHPARRG